MFRSYSAILLAIATIVTVSSCAAGPRPTGRSPAASEPEPYAPKGSMNIETALLGAAVELAHNPNCITKKQLESAGCAHLRKPAKSYQERDKKEIADFSKKIDTQFKQQKRSPTFSPKLPQN